MRVLHLGDPGALGQDLAEVFALAGHEWLRAPEPAGRGRARFEALLDREGRARESFDVVVDTGTRSAGDVRELVRAFAGRAGHYVLVSSCDVYPAVPRQRPWTPEEIDLGDEPGLAALDANAAGLRAAERELRFAGARAFPWTVLRPAIVEGPRDPSARAWWFVSRILDGGPIVLPTGGLPIYRHVLARDLARAVLAVSGQPRAHGRALNVTGSGMLSYWGHAAMTMDGLHRRVPFAYVPARRWRDAGLSLPYGEGASSSFVDHSPLLTELGWVPTDEWEWVTHLAQHLAANPRAVDTEAREAERRVVEETESEGDWIVRPGLLEHPRATPRQWHLTGRPGEPASLRLDRFARAPELPAPVLRTRRVALGAGVERMLLGEAPTPWPGPRAVGHNAVLELVEPGATGLEPGTRYVPLARVPCGDRECAFCRDQQAPFVLGIDADGFGAALVTTPVRHLVEIPKELAPLALLADPLAALLSALGPRLAGDARPVWVCGSSAEAALAGWLARDAERPVVHVARPVQDAPAFRDFDVRDVEAAVIAWERKEIPRPSLVVDTTGHHELARLLAFSLEADGVFVGRARPASLAETTGFVSLPPCAPDRAHLERAFAILRRWSLFRDPGARLGPAIAPDVFEDALLPAPFSQPFLDVVPEGA